MKELITAYLGKNNWKFIDSGAVLKLDVDGDELSWTTLLKVDESESFCCFSLLPTKISEEKFGVILKMMNEINAGIWFGGFELITEGSAAGQARFRTSAFVPKSADEQTSTEIIENTISFNEAAMNRFAAEIIKANYSDSED